MFVDLSRDARSLRLAGVADEMRDAEPTLRHVLWIGGAPGSGKTTIGRWLAHRYDLRSYNADAYTWAHHDRSLADGDAGATRWEALSADERWLAVPPDEMARFSLEMNAERFRKMVDDVRALPARPAVVMEGTPLLPWLVERHLTDDAAAVWLVPAPEFQRALLSERPTTTFAETSDPARALANRIERERRVSEAIERAAGERGYTVLRVDESRDVDTMKTLVEEALGASLAVAARASAGAELRAIRRSENEILLGQVRTYLERVPAAGAPEDVSLPFSCECGRSGCELRATLTPAACEQLVRGGAAIEAPEHG